MPGGGRVGFDPWLHTAAEIATLTEALEPRQITLRRTGNLVDRIWEDQPPPPSAPIVLHPEALAGRSSAEKRDDIARTLTERNLAAVALTLPDSIAWLLNLRGGDVARTPVALAFALLHADGTVDLVIDPAKIGPEAASGLGSQVRLHAPGAFGSLLDGLRGRVAVDKTSAPVWVSERLAAAGAEVVWTTDPCILPKACKTEAEIAGARAAHLRDGAVMAEFLCWLDATAPAGGLTEIDVVRRLEEIRAGTGQLRDISFDTICGAGPNGAIVHYRVSEASNRPVGPGELLLIDSGGQYPDGTTDITRTVAVGPVPTGGDRAFHSGAEGPDRDEPARLARGPRGARHRRGGAGGALARRARLRPWHRSRCGQLSRRARGAGGAVAALGRANPSGHDPLDRARLLP